MQTGLKRRVVRTAAAYLAVAVLILGFPLSAQSQSAGDLDDEFNGNGIVSAPISPLDAEANAVAIQPDGKIVIVGTSDFGSFQGSQFAVARLNNDGSLDARNFGNGGIITFPVPSASNTLPDEANAVAIQDDGKIVVAGTSDINSGQGSQFAVARLNSDGSLDTRNFGSGGIITFSIPNTSNTLPDEANAVAIQDDGKIVVAGTSDINSGQGSQFAVARLNSDGSLDIRNFGSGGIITFSIPNTANTLPDEAKAVAIQDDGKIVVAGTSDIGSAQGSLFAVLRLNPLNGSRDNSFGSNGIVRVSIPTNTNSPSAEAYAVAIQDDGKIVVAGTSDIRSAQGSRFAALRLLSEDANGNGLPTGASSGGCFIDAGRTGSLRNPF